MRNFKCSKCGSPLKHGYSCICGCDIADEIEPEILPGCAEWSVKLSNIANTLRDDDGLKIVLNNAAHAFKSYGRIIARYQSF